MYNMTVYEPCGMMHGYNEALVLPEPSALTSMSPGPGKQRPFLTATGQYF